MFSGSDINGIFPNLPQLCQQFNNVYEKRKKKNVTICDHNKLLYMLLTLVFTASNVSWPEGLSKTQDSARA